MKVKSRKLIFLVRQKVKWRHLKTTLACASEREPVKRNIETRAFVFIEVYIYSGAFLVPIHSLENIQFQKRRENILVTYTTLGQLNVLVCDEYG